MNKQYFQYLCKRHTKLFLVLIMLFVVAVPMFSLMPIESMNYGTYFDSRVTTDLYLRMAKWMMIFESVIIPLYLNAKYYRLSQVDFYYSLPLKRVKMRMSELLFGWLLMIVPMVIGLALMHIFTMNKVNYVNVQWVDIMIILLGVSFLYFMFFYIDEHANTLRNAIVLSILYYLLITYLPNIVSNFLYYYDPPYSSMQRDILWYIITFLSPFDMMLMKVGTDNLFHPILMNTIYVVCIGYLILCVGLCFFIIRFSKFKKAEQCGSNRILRTHKVLLGLILFVCLLSICRYLNRTEWVKWCIDVVILFGVYLGVICLIEGKIVFKNKYGAYFLLLVLGSYLFCTGYVLTSGMGRYYQYEKLNVNQFSKIEVLVINRCEKENCEGLYTRKEGTFELYTMDEKQLVDFEKKFNEKQREIIEDSKQVMLGKKEKAGEIDINYQLKENVYDDVKNYSVQYLVSEEMYRNWAAFELEELGKMENVKLRSDEYEKRSQEVSD